jgi:putative oxidoreductase
MTQHSLDFALLVLRVLLGGMIIMHGYNHLFGSGGVEGTARWFESLGFRPARVHALMSGGVELASGAGLVVGLLTPLAAAALIGTMVVAGWAAHRPNGFFIFRDGYEYVLIVAGAAFAVSVLGPGGFSLDNALGLVNYTDPSNAGLIGLTGGLVGAVGGVGGGVTLLVTGWRPITKASAEPAAAES